jgi:hypothetical protein
MQWVLQFLLPELIEATRGLGVPQQDTSAPASAAAPTSWQAGRAGADAGGSAATTLTSCWALHAQMAKAVSHTATTFGECGWLDGQPLSVLRLPFRSHFPFLSFPFLLSPFCLSWPCSICHALQHQQLRPGCVATYLNVYQVTPVKLGKATP